MRSGTNPLTALFAVAALFVASALGSDFSGRWSGAFKDADSGKEMPVYAVINQDGNKLTGTAGPDESRQMPIKTGEIEGYHLTFEVAMPVGTMAFDLMGVGPELRGKMKLSEDGHTANATIVLKRAH